MAPTTAHELLDWLDRNQFLAPDRVDALRPQLATWSDAHALARELINRAWLTPYQVNQILQNQGDALIVGPNRLLERIGEGAMGQIYRAWNVRLGSPVAVKVIHKEHVANAKALDRFRREVETASKLDHPNIVSVRDAGEVDGRPYMVMDFIDGEDLSRRVKQRGPLPVAEAADYARQAALGMQHAHERGVVHRDIKPGNLMLVRGQESGVTRQESGVSGESLALTPDSCSLTPVVKILDFGLARYESESGDGNRLTQIGSILGTVDYIAPEQAQNARSADIRADIYGLGCTLYCLLAGKPPFPGASVVEKITARMIDEPPSVRAERPEVSPGLDAVVRRMMARRPEDRYQTPLEAAQALAPFANAADPTAPAAMSVGLAGAAQTAHTLAQAIAAPLPAAAAELPQAYPIAQPVPSGSAPTARAYPIASLVAESEIPVVVAALSMPAESGQPHATDAGFGDTRSTEMPLPVPGSRATPATPTRFNTRLALYASGAVVGVTVVVFIVLGLTSNSGPSAQPKKTYGPDASLHLLPIDAIVCKAGDRKPVIVKIERKGFYGPVRIRFEDLPESVIAKEITLTDKQVTSQFMLTVRYGFDATRKDARLIASAENLQDSITVPITVEALKD